MLRDNEPLGKAAPGRPPVWQTWVRSSVQKFVEKRPSCVPATEQDLLRRSSSLRGWISYSHAVPPVMFIGQCIKFLFCLIQRGAYIF